MSEYKKTFVAKKNYEKYFTGKSTKYMAFLVVFGALFFCSCRNGSADVAQSSDVQTEDTLKTITEAMAYEGVSNYCHREYDWSLAKDNPAIMSLQMGEETDSTYQVVFRSYTGAFVHFYVDKTTGSIKIVEKVPSLNIEEEAGNMNLFDYLETQN